MSRKTRRNAARRAANAPGKLPLISAIPIIHRPSARVGFAGLALGSLAWSGSLYAADVPAAPAEAPLQEVVVTGMRESLKNAQQLKKDADIIQDSISAQDIGALPDQSVTETLQRLPGVAINQFAAGVDPDHFSIEGSGIVVRGLDSRTRSELNGRDTFSANNGRSISFADIPPELLIGVDVFKSPSANMIEGGIAGTVNLRTRVPFDAPGRIFSVNGEANYGDFAKTWRPSFSALFSDRRQSDIGEFGALVNYVDSKLNSRADGVQASNFGCRTNLTSGGNPITSPSVSCPPNPDPGQESAPGIFFPRGAAFRSQTFARERKGAAAALQWKSPDESLLATVQFLRSDSTEAWTEHAIEIATDNVTASGDSYPVPGSTFDVSSSGVFTNGAISDMNGYRADQWGGTHRTPVNGLQSNNIDRSVFQEYITQDLSFNLKWDITEKLHAKLDFQHVNSSVNDIDNGIWGSSFQDVSLAVNGGSKPTAFTFQPVYNVNTPGTSCTVPSTSNNCSNYYDPAHASYSDPYNSFWRSAMDHIEQSDGFEKAAALDLRYEVSDGGFARSLDFGVRWSDRNETTRFSTYNWGVLSEIWGNNGPVWMDSPVGNGTALGGPSVIAPYAFSNFFRGQVPVPTGNQPLPFYTGNPAAAYKSYTAFAESVRDAWLAQGGAAPVGACGASGASGWVPLASRCGVVPGSPFLPGEINPVDEKTKDAYLMLNFGHDFGDHRFTGNLGVRYTRTNRVATGFLQYPDGGGIPDEATCAAPTTNGQLPPVACQTSAAYRAALRSWANNATSALNSGSAYSYWLPSLNFKLGLTQDLILRGGLSRSITPPQIGYVRGDYTLGTFTYQGTVTTPQGTLLLLNPDGTPQQTPRSAGTFGNPLLKPESSDNLDLSLEWYFGPVASVTTAVFAKRLHDVVVNNTSVVNYTNSGVTIPVVLTQPGNSPDTGKIFGLELGYQQTYDFLPKPLDGLGIAANYTLLHSSGVPQSTLSATDPDVGAGRVTNINIGLLPLEGLSKQSYNTTLFYNKGPWDVRLAWSWRSAFLLTARDVIVPYAPIMNENTGTLSASFFYNLTPEIKIGVQGNNLLDNVTRTSQILNDQLLRAPRSFFIEDRRVSLILRATF
ncbi:MAG TPA: TonB-dependent receptor [Steroidobacteraceae bacterium]